MMANTRRSILKTAATGGDDVGRRRGSDPLACAEDAFSFIIGQA
jgi:hypothetical protein